MAINGAINILVEPLDGLASFHEHTRAKNNCITYTRNRVRLLSVPTFKARNQNSTKLKANKCLLLLNE